jgi:negative regulator of genetic competence, sporulation and motility
LNEGDDEEEEEEEEEETREQVKAEEQEEEEEEEEQEPVAIPKVLYFHSIKKIKKNSKVAYVLYQIEYFKKE